MLHQLSALWFQLLQGIFHLVQAWGYPGVFLFMAVESSVFPLPSEIIIPPAAYYAALGRFDMTLIVLVGTAGSLFGSLVMYGLSLLIGRPLLYRYGRFVFLSPKKIEMAERFLLRYAKGGIFFGRLLPVVRHLQSIPAGLARMNLGAFALFTTLGAGAWCTVLAWFGKNVLGSDPHLLDSWETLRHALQAKLHWFVAAVVVLLGLYLLAVRLARPPQGQTASAD